MIPPPFLQVLREIHARLAGQGVRWVLTGSLSFALQGMPVTPHDIDLQSDAAGAYQIERCLAEFVVQPVSFSSAGTIRSHFGRLQMAGLQVDIIGDIEKRLPGEPWSAPPDLERYRRKVALGDLCVPVLSLEYEAEAYARMGRVRRSEELRQWLQAAGERSR